MKPDSHREQPLPDKACHNCKYARFVHHKHHLLCFYNDTIETQPLKDGTDDVTFVVGNCRHNVSLLKDSHYLRLWRDRIVDQSDVCDEHQPIHAPNRSTNS